MRVLITNNTLASRAGTELYVRDIALQLLARGHSPIAYSRRLGEVAVELRKATVPVVEDLAAVGEPPDLIHGQHHLETVTATLHFPTAPVIAFCHGWEPWEESAVRFPSIRRHVAVDEPTRERLVSECGVPPERVALHLNFVDLDRFQPRSPLPKRPRRALVFNNLASEENCLPAIRSACRKMEIELDAAGVACGNPCSKPEEILGDYDVVFARARAALEAAAVGTSVVLCDPTGLGPMVSAAELDRLRPLNFGLRTLKLPVTPMAVSEALARYDPADVQRVQQRLRREASLDAAVDRLLDLYTEVLAEHRSEDPPVNTGEMARAAARYLRHGPLRGGDPWIPERDRLRVDLARCRGSLAVVSGDRDRLAGERALLDQQAVAREFELGNLKSLFTAERAEAERLRSELASEAAKAAKSSAEVARLDKLLQEITGTATWRIRESFLGKGWLASVYRRLRRRPSS